MHFSEISFSENLETLKFKHFSFGANYVGAFRGITKQANSHPDSNFRKLTTVFFVNKKYRKFCHETFKAFNICQLHFANGHKMFKCIQRQSLFVRLCVFSMFSSLFLMILVHNFMLIKNHIESWVWKSAEMKLFTFNVL